MLRTCTIEQQLAAERGSRNDQSGRDRLALSTSTMRSRVQTNTHNNNWYRTMITLNMNISQIVQFFTLPTQNMQLYMLLWNQETCNCDIIAMDRCTQLRNVERNAQIMTFRHRQTRNLLVVAFTHCHTLFKLCLIFVHFDFSPSSDAAALWLSVKVCHSLC